MFSLFSLEKKRLRCDLNAVCNFRQKVSRNEALTFYPWCLLRHVREWLKNLYWGIHLFTLDFRNMQFPEQVDQSLAQSAQARVQGPKLVFGVQDMCIQLIYVFTSRFFAWNQDLDLIFLCLFQIRIIHGPIILMRVYTLQELVLNNFQLPAFSQQILCPWMLLM